MTQRDNEPTTSDQRKQPTWLTEPCPDWCAREHDELDHPEDRYHQSEGEVLPGVVATRPTIPVHASLEALDLIVWAGRYAGETTDWMVIEPVGKREPRLVVTVETARRLVTHLSNQLASHGS